MLGGPSHGDAESTGVSRIYSPILCHSRPGASPLQRSPRGRRPPRGNADSPASTGTCRPGSVHQRRAAPRSRGSASTGAFQAHVWRLHPSARCPSAFRSPGPLCPSHVGPGGAAADKSQNMPRKAMHRGAGVPVPRRASQGRAGSSTCCALWLPRQLEHPVLWRQQGTLMGRAGAGHDFT